MHVYGGLISRRRFYPPTESDIPLHGWRPYSDLHRERVRAHEKHDDHGQSMERKTWDDESWLRVVTEELGEVARALNDREMAGRVREELVQLGAMTTAWIDAIDLRN